MFPIFHQNGGDAELGFVETHYSARGLRLVHVMLHRWMDGFHWITTTVGMVIALGMTRLLASGVSLFRSRRRATIDWVPVIWAMSIFYSMLDFSWNLRNPSGLVPEWTFARCLILIGFALILFVAASLILPLTELPQGGDLRSEFAQDGRWALSFLGGYDFLCVAFNWFYWHEPPFSMEGALNFLLGGLAFTAVRLREPKVEITVALIYAVTIFGTAFFMDL